MKAKKWIRKLENIMIKIEWIIEKVKKDDYYFSKHGDIERQNDDLSIIEVEESLINGKILEEYEDTGRGESCLVVGFTNSGKPIHIVCGVREDILVIITVYIPTSPKFKNLYKRSR